MSQLRQPTPTPSPTPSKSSLRRTSGPPTPSQRSLIPPPSPHFDQHPPTPVRYSPRSPPNQTLEYESDENDEPLLYPDHPPITDDDESYFPSDTPFQPFFTLVEDNLTSEHHHPSVHYIFSDDDTEMITKAALRSISPDPRPTIEHCLILDVVPGPHSNSYTVASSASLSPIWQVTSARVCSAPTFGDQPASAASEGLMLRIEGHGMPDEDLDRMVGLEELIERFQNRLGEVKRLMDVDAGVGVGTGVFEGGEGDADQEKEQD